MPNYVQSVELLDVAETLKGLHPELKYLQVGYLFRDKAIVSRGAVTAGMCVRVDDRNHALNGFDVIVEIAKDLWDMLPASMRTMVMDHELCHIGLEMEGDDTPALDNKGRLKVFIKRHDFEDFEAVLDRHPDSRKTFKSFAVQYLDSLKKAE